MINKLTLFLQLYNHIAKSEFTSKASTQYSNITSDSCYNIIVESFRCQDGFLMNTLGYKPNTRQDTLLQNFFDIIR